jgi:hypothetical protein
MKKIQSTIIFLTLSSFLWAQNFVSTISNNKNVLLQTFGGINCFYCTEGDYRAQVLQNNNNDRVVWMNVHAGIFAIPNSNQPDFRSIYADTLLTVAGLTTFPAAVINKRYFPSLSQSQNSLAIGDINWTLAADSILSESSPINIAAEAVLDISNRTIKVVVETFYTANTNTSNQKIYAAILLDNILGPNQGDSSLNPIAFQQNGQYNNRFLFMDYLTSGLTVNNTGTGYFQADTIFYNLPNDFNGLDFDFLNPKITVWIADNDSSEVYTASYATMNLISSNNLDAEIVNADWNTDFDLICGQESPITITIQNLGNTPIDSVQIYYNVNAGQFIDSFTHVFSSSIVIANKAEIFNPGILNLNLPSNSVEWTIQKINGNQVSNPILVNNSIDHASLVVSDSTNGIFRIRFDSYPQDISWFLKDETLDSILIVDSLNYGANSTITQNFTVTDGHCYTFKVSDSAGDGICCAAGQGFYSLKIGNLEILQDADFAFESGTKFEFQKGVIAVNPIEDNGLAFDVFPNPAKGQSTLRINSEDNMEVDFAIYNTLGQLLYSENSISLNSGVHYKDLNLDNFKAGMYYLVLSSGNKRSSKKLIVSE